jgi:hypothetical protein
MPAMHPSSLSFQLILFPLASSFTMPLLVGLLVSEKNKGLWAIMKINSLRTPAFWAALYVYGMVMFMTVSTILIIGGYGMSLASFTNASPLLFVLLLLCWSHAQIGMATLISGAMQHMPNVATLVAYMIVISTPVLSAVLNSPSSGFANDYPFGMLLVPPLAFSRSLYLVMLRGGDSIPLSSPLALPLFMLFLDGTICFVVGIWFYLVLSDKKWQPLHPLFAASHRLYQRCALTRPILTRGRCQRESRRTSYQSHRADHQPEYPAGQGRHPTSACASTATSMPTQEDSQMQPLIQTSWRRSAGWSVRASMAAR